MLAVVAVGCQSTAKKLGSDRVAAVVVKNATSTQIEEATKTVFERRGFDAAPEDYNDLVFQRKGSFMHGLFYGDWYEGAVWVRMKLFLRDLSPDSTLVDCDVYMVQEPEDPLFQKERKVRSNKSECQKLLDEIAAELTHK